MFLRMCFPKEQTYDVRLFFRLGMKTKRTSTLLAVIEEVVGKIMKGCRVVLKGIREGTDGGWEYGGNGRAATLLTWRSGEECC